MTAKAGEESREHLARLSSPDPAVRLKACAHLLKIWLDTREHVPPAVVEALYRMLHDRDASVRGVVQRWLIERPEIVLTMTVEEKNHSAVTVSRAILKATDAASIRALTEIVGGLSQSAACQVLENAIDGTDIAAVANAAFALGRMAGYCGATGDAMRHHHPVVRAAALMGVGDGESVKVEREDDFIAELFRCLEDTGPLADVVRAKAASLIAPFRVVRAIRALVRAYFNGDPATRHNVRHALLVGGADFADGLAAAGATDERARALVAEVRHLSAVAASPASSDETHESQSPWFPLPVAWLSRSELEARGLL
ncbi:MAG: hypothetical protein HYY84_06430 [Deltaproteobacteria bacterium]|nr:hypothetical protein [Deltaproteobacteria bacterium]